MNQSDIKNYLKALSELECSRYTLNEIIAVLENSFSKELSSAQDGISEVKAFIAQCINGTANASNLNETLENIYASHKSKIDAVYSTWCE